MIEQNPLDSVVAYLDALTGKDFETAASYLAEDFVFQGLIRQYKSADEFLLDPLLLAVVDRAQLERCLQVAPGPLDLE